MRPKFSSAHVMAALALLISMGGTAVAAATLTGANVKNGTITSLDIANGPKGVNGLDIRNESIRSGDIATGGVRGIDVKNASIGPADLTDNAKAAMTGAKGATGARGLSSWDVIPAGRTVTGSFTWRAPNNEPGLFLQSIDLPGVARAALTHPTVSFAPDGAITPNSDPTCTGTGANPTAPKGKVCMYLVSASDDIDAVTASAGLLPKRSFIVGWGNEDAIAPPLPGEFLESYVYATWAYTGV